MKRDVGFIEYTEEFMLIFSHKFESLIKRFVAEFTASDSHN
jgi:hypothetical protein